VCDRGYSSSAGLNATGIKSGDIGIAGPTVLRCDASSKSWEGMPPVCDECALNYFKQGDSCFPCSTSECPRGMYRAACAQTSDASCVPCTSPLPANAYYATGGNPYYLDNCITACSAGFYLPSSGSSCEQINPTTPALTVGLPTTPQVAESSQLFKIPVTMSLSLTVPPTSPVLVTITVSRQLVLMENSGSRPADPVRSKVVTFTPANYFQIQNVSIDAWDDNVYEGEHSGLVHMTMDSADPAYNKLQVLCLSFCDRSWLG
jgi:hypothetical protein